MKKILKPIVLAATIAVSQHSVLSQAQQNRPTQDIAEMKPPVEVQLAQTRDAMRDMKDALVFISDAPPSRSGPGESLIIPKDSADPKNFSEIEEDLAVMSRVLEKAAGANDKSRSAMGITVYGKAFGGRPAARNLYIEGYGALFFLNVNFPLVPPPAERAETQSKPETSSEWEEARRELSRPPASGFNFSLPPGSGDLWSATGPAEEFDAEKVEELKQDLVAALKNAAHIRKLKPEDTVTVVVAGRNPVGGKVATKTIRRSNPRPPEPPTPVVAPPPAGREAKLIIRARRSDIEAFQKEKLSTEDFRKKVTLMVF